jgi:hypothetical protein
MTQSGKLIEKEESSDADSSDVEKLHEDSREPSKQTVPEGGSSDDDQESVLGRESHMSRAIRRAKSRGSVSKVSARTEDSKGGSKRNSISDPEPEENSADDDDEVNIFFSLALSFSGLVCNTIFSYGFLRTVCAAEMQLMASRVVCPM